MFSNVVSNKNWLNSLEKSLTKQTLIKYDFNGLFKACQVKGYASMKRIDGIFIDLIDHLTTVFENFLFANDFWIVYLSGGGFWRAFS